MRPSSISNSPLDPVPTRGGCLLLLKSGVFDQRELESRPDVAIFTTEPLDAPLEVTGRLTARIELVCDQVDTDVAVKLTDVYPDGRSYNIADGLARCRMREGFDRLALLTPGEPASIDVDLWSTSHIFNRGHRIRVAISGSNYPRFDVNPNTGWPLLPMGPMQPAHHRILCSSERASQIILPVVRR
jgi:putative CocE/NonD family hydrolase